MVAWDKCLDDSSDDISTALQLFSRRQVIFNTLLSMLLDVIITDFIQVPEGLALWSLLQLPPKGVLKPFYLLNQLVKGILSKFIIWVTPPTQLLLSQTLTPFSIIAQKVPY